MLFLCFSLFVSSFLTIGAFNLFKLLNSWCAEAIRAVLSTLELEAVGQATVHLDRDITLWLGMKHQCADYQRVFVMSE